MKYSKILAGLKDFGVQEPEQICRFSLGVWPEQIRNTVVIAPFWNPSSLFKKEQIKLLKSENPSTIIWDIDSERGVFTFIHTGMGASFVMDTILGLGVTQCQQILFIGSVGALQAELKIGDLVLPELSLSGDGATRYLVNTILQEVDTFAQPAYPEPILFDRLAKITSDECETSKTTFHRVKNFSVDTIFAQYSHLQEIIDLGCVIRSKWKRLLLLKLQKRLTFHVPLC